MLQCCCLRYCGFVFNHTLNQCDWCVVGGACVQSHDVWLLGTTCHYEYAELKDYHSHLSRSFCGHREICCSCQFSKNTIVILYVYIFHFYLKRQAQAEYVLCLSTIPTKGPKPTTCLFTLQLPYTAAKSHVFICVVVFEPAGQQLSIYCM